ncbi:hypothetical protein KAX02_13505 [candidate division WOR-3 bacterium]|nr:hypothetical protein [candidate division WOR-3 bacterium]
MWNVKSIWRKAIDEYQSISVYQQISRQNIRLSEYQEVGAPPLAGRREKRGTGETGKREEGS